MAQVSYGTITITDTNDIESITIEYARNQDPLTAPTSGWNTTRPNWAQGYYIWQRTRIHKTGTSTSTDTFGDAVCLTGSTGQTGTSVTVSSIKYAISTTESQPADSSFTYTSVPTVAEGSWLWTLVTYSNGSKAYTKSKQGVSGDSITVSKVEYQSGTSPTSAPTGTWKTSIPTVAEGNYLWTKTTYSDGNYTYSVAKQGKSGTSVSISSTSTTYQVSTSPTTTPTGEWKPTVQSTTTGQYLWTRTIVTYSDGNSTTSYSVAAHGATGTSVSISSIKYAVSSTDSQPADSSFTYTSVPTVSEGQWLWTLTTYSNGSKMYTKSKQGKSGDAGQSLTATKTQYTHVASNVTITTSNHTSYTWTDNVPEYDSTKPVYWGRITNTYSNPSKTEYIVYKDNGLTEAIAKSVEANANAAEALDKSNEAESIATHANEDAQGAMSQAASNLNSVIRLWYAKANSTAPAAPTSGVTTGSTSTYNAWSTIKPADNASYQYYFYCDQSCTGGGVYSWSNVTLDTSTLSQYQIGALTTKVRNYWWDDAGAHIASGTSTSGEISKTSPTSSYGYNTLTGLTGISFKYNDAKVVDLNSTTPSLDFYQPPTISGSTVTQGKKTMMLSANALRFYNPTNGTTEQAVLDTNGLILKKGGIKAGTAGQSGFIYLSTENYGSNLTINNHQASNWREIIGTKFGVDADGNLYASNTHISGVISVTNGSDLSAGLGDYTKTADLANTTAVQDAKKIATNFLSADSSGVMVYDGSSGVQMPSSPSANTKNVLISSNGMYVRNGSTNLASFTGSSAQIGQSSVAHSIVDANGMRVYASDGVTPIANLGYGEGTAESGTSNAPFYTLGTRYPSTAPQYDSTSTYEAEDYCVYNGKVWRCVSAISTPEAFNTDHWWNLIGNESMAEGKDVEASGYLSHAEGRLTRATSSYSHAEGHSTEAIGPGSHAEGWHINQQANVARGISASGGGSHAEGIAQGTFRIIASGDGSHAEGYARNANNIAQGNGSHVEGRGNTASGLYTHAEGNENTASGGASHAEGEATEASGYSSHAEGMHTVAYGQCSHAQNLGTVANAVNQTALGQYNVPDTTSSVIIGNGSSATRSNALTVDWNGNVNIASGAKYKINGNNLSASDIENSVTGVKGNSESSYRTGNVNLTPANIGAVPTTRTVNSKALSSNITLTASDVSAVPTTRTVNSKALSANITLSASDVGALPLSGGTMTGQIKTSFKESVAMGSYGAAASTVPNLVAELRFSSGCMGSASISTAYTNGSITIGAGWYNFIYSPHRSGGANGAASGDNCNYGNLLLMGMTVGGAYLIRVASAAIQEVKVLGSDYVRAEFLPTTGNSYANYGGCYYEKYGRVVHVHVGVMSLTTGTATNIYTLPSGFRPTTVVYAHGTGGTWNNIGYMEISTAGVVTVRSQGTYCGADITFLA